jgi:hypothetical protein
MNAETLAKKLNNVTFAGGGGWWRASCPGPKHESGNRRRPMLTFRDTEDGLQMKCHGGCTRGDILDALARSMAGLKPDTKPRTKKSATATTPEPVAEEKEPLGPIVAEYVYKTKDGQPAFMRTRHDPKDFRWQTWIPSEDGSRGTWIKKLIGQPPLYALPGIQGKKDVIIVEGEKDVERAWTSLQFPTTTSGNAGSWKPEHSEQLKDAGCERAWIIPDGDDVGMEHAETVAMGCTGVGIDARIVKIIDPEEKAKLAAEGKPLNDLSDWLNARHTEKELLALFDETPRALPSINADEQDLRVISAQAWDAVVRANGDNPTIFRFGNRVATLTLQENAAPQIETVNEQDFRFLLARMANWKKLKNKRVVPAKPPKHAIDDMFSRVNLLSREAPIPQLLRIIETPVFASDGRFDQTLGYQPVGRVYLETGGLEIPEVPMKPTDKDVDEAKDILFARKDSLLGEFPFKESASVANAIACMLEPFVRDVFKVPSPFYMIKKPVTGTGATYLAQALMIPFLGRVVGVMSECKDEDEWRKRLTAKLKLLEPVIIIDNINRPLGNGHLCGAITTATWEDRILGETRMLKIPISTTWIGTANNPTMTTEMLSRVVWIRLEAKMDEMLLRERKWIHRNLHGWALDERPRLLWACAVLVRRWFAAGAPLWEGPARFSRWAEVMGGILDSVGIEGFLDNRDEERDAVDDSHSSMRAFVTQVWGPKYGEREVAAKDLLGDVLAAGSLSEGIGIEGEDLLAQVVSLSKRLNKEYRDVWFGDWAVRLGKKRHNLQHYRLQKGSEAMPLVRRDA